MLATHSSWIVEKENSAPLRLSMVWLVVKSAVFIGDADAGLGKRSGNKRN
jgi:hypothetical protein